MHLLAQSLVAFYSGSYDYFPSQCSLGVQFFNPNVASEMAQLLMTNHEKYVPSFKTTHGKTARLRRLRLQRLSSTSKVRENSRQKCRKTHMETWAMNQAYQRSLFRWGGKNRGSIFSWTRSMDWVHGGGPWTRDPCFVLSRLIFCTRQ